MVPAMLRKLTSIGTLIAALFVASNAFAQLEPEDQDALIAFLNSLIIFPPDDTASNLDPGNRTSPNFPQFGHGSIKLTVLFNNPADPE